MDWSDVGKIIGDAAPILGNVLVGNIPGAIASAGSLLASAFGVQNNPAAVAAAIQGDPDAPVKLAQIEADNKVQLQQLVVSSAANALAADTARIQSVNATIQADATGKSWLQRNTHSIAVLMTVSAVLAVYFVLPLLNKPVPAVPEFAWGMLGAILGVAAWHNGVSKVKATGAGEGVTP